MTRRPGEARGGIRGPGPLNRGLQLALPQGKSQLKEGPETQAGPGEKPEGKARSNLPNYWIPFKNQKNDETKNPDKKNDLKNEKMD